jgi:hypothetical protein
VAPPVTATQATRSSTAGFGPDRYEGLNVVQVIQLLRKRLNWDTNIERIIDERQEEPSKSTTQPGKSIQKTLYSLQDDGVFAYAVLKDLANPVARYNPYDLVCVGASRTFDLKQMFTVTASAVTQVCLLICFSPLTPGGGFYSGVEKQFCRKLGNCLIHNWFFFSSHERRKKQT